MPTVIDSLDTLDFIDQTIQETLNYYSGTFWVSDAHTKREIPYACFQ